MINPLYETNWMCGLSNWHTSVILDGLISSLAAFLPLGSALLSPLDNNNEKYLTYAGSACLIEKGILWQ